ncbi:unnamed protein product [Effrenium voratum]|nr:unnamed protein product [Effrenium voratum]
MQPPRRPSIRDKLDRRKSLQDELLAVESDEAHDSTPRNNEDDDEGELWCGNEGTGLDMEESEESSFMDEDEIEARSELQDGDRESQDKILDWWCQRQLLRVVRRLARLPKAGPFKEPLPWKELGLDDYPEVISDPIDLRTIAARLQDGEYKDEEGFVNPDIFWQEVAQCWENCKVYYEDDTEIEAVRMAEEMRLEAEALEEEFWQDLEKFEESLDRVKGKALSKVAAVADVAKGAMQDAASLAMQESMKLAKRTQDWWNKLRGKKPEELEKKDIHVLQIEVKPRLRDHFLEMLKMRFRVDGWEDVMGIEEEVIVGMRENWPILEEESDLVGYLPEPGANFSKKVAIERLLPTKYVAYVHGASRSTRHARGESSLASSRSSVRSSRFGAAMTGSRRNSHESSRAGSRMGSRGQSPARSETSASRQQTPRSYRSEGEGSISAFSHGSDASKMMNRAVRASVLEAGVAQVPGIESSSESDPEKPEINAPSVQRLSMMMPPKGRTSVVGKA